jgi:hypothetical protein
MRIVGASLSAALLVACGDGSRAGTPTGTPIARESVASGSPSATVTASASATPPPTPSSAPAPSVSGTSDEPAGRPDLSDAETPPAKGWPPGYVPSRVRESVTLDLASGRETWLLRWKADPEPACFSETAQQTARCLLLAGPGESGAIELVRVVGGQDVARMDLTEILGDPGRAVLPRFPKGVRFSARALAEAKPLRLMVLRDVNQDGLAAEMLLPGRWRWGERASYLAGFSPTTHRGFAYYARRASDWEAVAQMKDRLEIVTTPCLDHASPSEYFDLFEKGPKGISRTQEQWACDVVGDAVVRRKREDTSTAEPLGL